MDFTAEMKFLLLLSCIPIDSFFEPAIALVLLRSCENKILTTLSVAATDFIDEVVNSDGAYG